MHVRNEVLVKQGVIHPDIDEENLDEETIGRLTGWIHNNHFTDNKLNNDRISDINLNNGDVRPGHCGGPEGHEM